MPHPVHPEAAFLKMSFHVSESQRDCQTLARGSRPQAEHPGKCAARTIRPRQGSRKRPLNPRTADHTRSPPGPTSRSIPPGTSSSGGARPASRCIP